MASVKALLGGGLAALCEHIKGIRTTVGDLAEATAQSVDEIDGILHEKQDINSKVAFTIPTTGWGFFRTPASQIHRHHSFRAP